MGKKLILFACLICIMAFGASGAETAKTLRTSSFIAAPTITPFNKITSTSFCIYEIPAGTEAELLEYNGYYSQFIKVRLADGSIGYMSALAFFEATLNIDTYRHHIKTSSGKLIPDGVYSVVTSGTLRYRNDVKIPSSINGGFTAVDERIVLKGIKGTYSITGVNTYEERYKDDTRYWEYSPLTRLYDFGEHNQLLKDLPAGKLSREKFKLRFNPEKTSLDAFVGCSKSYIEFVFGEPYAYVGAGLSEVPDMTYAVYDNILWKYDKRHVNKGVVVYYDNDLIVRHIEMRAFEWGLAEFKADAAPLYVPLHPLATADEATVQALENRPGLVIKAKGSDSYTIPTEKVTKPGLLDRIRITVMYFYERVLGIESVWAIVGVMLLIQLLICLFIAYWIRFVLNYGSNGWANARCILLPLPIAIINLIYLWRYPFLFFAFFGMFVLAMIAVPQLILNNAINYRRCPKCHKYSRPKILSSKDGMFHGKDYFKTSRRETLNFVSDRFGDRDAGAFIQLEEYKYETVMTVTQDMKYGVKCTECGYEWEQDKTEERPSVRGPILIERIETNHVHSTRTTTTTTTERDEYGNETTREDVDRNTTTDRDDYVRTRYDVDEYLKYYRKYINGDKDALDRYYRDRWGVITWNMIK